ncbi:response regulator [Pontibacter harenae]|uniref:response regulator n=1 Tax=Pontibacter harenae TaxID=2894083 RepID=UPI001E52ACFC|nr:response regulator [Pontibacter harenae]MCC9166225.1 response regulator [Pontibacter harenae]
MKSKTNIYIVEDDILFRELIQDYLEIHLNDKLRQIEYKKYSAGERLINELQGIEKSHLKASEQHVVILDYKLSPIYSNEVLNGLEVLQQLKSLSIPITVIVVSGQEDIAVVDNLLDAGAVDYISKNENAFPRLQRSLERLLNKNTEESSKPKILYEVVYRDNPKKVSRRKLYKNFALGMSALAVAELVFILLGKVAF